MKKQILLLLAVLLTSTAAIALTLLPETQSNTVHLSVTITPNGAGSVDRPERDIVKGGKATFTAVANAGYSFDGWYVNETLVSNANPYQFTSLQEDLNIVAKFNSLAASSLILNVKSGCEGMGTVNVNPESTIVEGVRKYNTGSALTVSATSSKGHQFVRWEDGNGAEVSTNVSYWQSPIRFSLLPRAAAWGRYGGCRVRR
jgi:uncharacterized repeat protein (TIGR02543 family)